ncbi:hypothetical protein HK104_006477 [Borealophlyctis nickersoniae]|nr:hypothetical protein HK104_006477 [Borealophlyctis nickersoniae]
MSAEPTLRDNISHRGIKGDNALGRAIFVSLRAADPLLQYLIFAKGWGNAVFAIVGLSSTAPVIGMLSPRQKLVVAFSSIAAARQIFWCLYLNENVMTAGDALNIAIYNLTVDTMNSFLSLRVAGWYWELHQYIGTALYAVGSMLETVSEVQRKWFRSKKENKGLVATGGLWRAARHINYGGYLLWRGGYALGTGNLYALWNPLFHAWDFTQRGVPVLDRYMANKYKDQWAAYARTTRYRLLPYIW